VPRIAGTLGQNGLYYPIIKIEVSIHGLGKLPVDALIDSGADYATLPLERLRAAFGIDWDQLTPVADVMNTAGGPVEQRSWKGEIRWRSQRVARDFRVVRDLAIPVVGREDFFHRFTVDFSGWNGNPPYVQIERRR